jgi:hypothetical protein
MHEKRLRSEYHKLAYLQLIDVEPLVAVRQPRLQECRVRYNVAVNLSEVRARSELDAPVRDEVLKRDIALLSRDRENGIDQLIDMREELQEVSQGADIQEPEPSELSKHRLTEGPETSIRLPDSFSVLIYQSAGCVLIALEPIFDAIHMNLLRNVTLACNPPTFAESGRPPPLELLEFRWPIANLDGAAEQTAAKYAMSGFLKRNLGGLSRFIFFGGLAQQVVEIYLADIDSPELIVTDSLDELLQSPNKKHALWTEMRNRGFA